MFFQELGKGFSAYSDAHRVISKYNLWRFLVIPGLLSLAYAVLLVVGGYFLQDNLVDWMVGWISWGWVQSILRWVIGLFFWAFLILLGWFTYRFVVLIFLSPFLTNLSQIVEKKVYGTGPPETTYSDALKDILRALALNIRNLLLEILICIPLYFIPLCNPFVIFTVQSFYSGFGLMDFTMERKRMGLSSSIRFVNQHKGLATGIGMVFQLMMVIPFVGWLLAPTYGTVAATLASLKILENER